MADFDNFPFSPAFYMKDGNSYKIINTRFSIAKQFVSPYENLNTAEELCNVQIDKDKVLNLSMSDIILK